jgi:hypothetical protein
MRSRIDSWTRIALISSGAKNPTWHDSELVAELPAGDGAGEADGELLAYLSVGVLDDVTRVRVRRRGSSHNRRCLRRRPGGSEST